MAIGKQVAPAANLNAFIDWALRDGARASEHPAHGGVTKGAHTKGSWHYDGLAVDLNWGPKGAPAIERQHALKAIEVGRAFGLGIIYARDGKYASAANHTDHLHADCGSSTNLGRQYETHTTAPSIRTYRLQCAVRAERDNRWGPDTDKRLKAVREASKYRGSGFPWGVTYVQEVLGVTADGVWGPKSRAAHDDAVEAIQRALGVTADGVWGKVTEAAYQRARTEDAR